MNMTKKPLKTVRIEVVEKTVLSVLVSVPNDMETDEVEDRINCRSINWDAYEKDGDREMYNLITEEEGEAEMSLRSFFKRYFPTKE